MIYKSLRIGKNGKEFTLYKFQTLLDSTDGNRPFAHLNSYTRFGKFLRKYKLDEAPQIWNIIKRDMNFVGIRPEEAKSIAIYPEELKKKLLSRRPGWFSLSGLYFLHEEDILKESLNPYKDYWTKIRQLKLVLDLFYLENRGILLDLWIIYNGLKKMIHEATDSTE